MKNPKIEIKKQNYKYLNLIVNNQHVVIKSKTQENI